MFCKYCGEPLAEGASFCSKCGKKVDTAEEYTNATNGDNAFLYTFPTQESAAPASACNDEARSAHGGKILLFAILALAFSVTLYLAPVGIVFCILARVQLSKYLAIYSETEGRASVGKGLSIASLPVSIVMTSILLFTILILLLA